MALNGRFHLASSAKRRLRSLRPLTGLSRGSSESMCQKVLREDIGDALTGVRAARVLRGACRVGGVTPIPGTDRPALDQIGDAPRWASV